MYGMLRRSDPSVQWKHSLSAAVCEYDICEVQRLRDQIRAWLLMSEAKDVDGLPEARRAIEIDMVPLRFFTPLPTIILRFFASVAVCQLLLRGSSPLFQRLG